MTSTDGSGSFEIRVAVSLDPHWQAWFEPLSLRLDADGTTLLAGELSDQAALHGILQRIRDAGMPLLSVTSLPTPPPHPTRTDHD